MTEEIIIDECFNCKKKKNMGDNWRTCKLKCSYKYKRKENDYITRLEQENEKLKEENVKLLFGKGALIKLCDNLTKIIDEKKEKESKLWQALEEIRELVEKSIKISYNLEVNSMLYDIIDKINEVLE